MTVEKIEKRGWRIAELMAMYGVKRGFLMHAIKQGKIQVQKLGKVVIILDEERLRFFENKGSR